MVNHRCFPSVAYTILIAYCSGSFLAISFANGVVGCRNGAEYDCTNESIGVPPIFHNPPLSVLDALSQQRFLDNNISNQESNRKGMVASDRFSRRTDNGGESFHREQTSSRDAHVGIGGYCLKLGNISALASHFRRHPPLVTNSFTAFQRANNDKRPSFCFSCLFEHTVSLCKLSACWADLSPT